MRGYGERERDQESNRSCQNTHTHTHTNTRKRHASTKTTQKENDIGQKRGKEVRFARSVVAMSSTFLTRFLPAYCTPPVFTTHGYLGRSILQQQSSLPLLFSCLSLHLYANHVAAYRLNSRGRGWTRKSRSMRWRGERHAARRSTLATAPMPLSRQNAAAPFKQENARGRQKSGEREGSDHPKRAP